MVAGLVHFSLGWRCRGSSTFSIRLTKIFRVYDSSYGIRLFVFELRTEARVEPHDEGRGLHSNVEVRILLLSADDVPDGYLSWICDGVSV